MPDPESERLIEVINYKDRKIAQLKKKITGYKNKIKELNDQKDGELKETKKERKFLKGKKDQFEKEVIQLKKNIEELKEEHKKKDVKMDSLENTIEENKKSHQKEMEDMKEGYKRLIQKLKESHNEELKKLEDYRIAYKMNEDENQKLKEENKELKGHSKDIKKHIRNYENDLNKLIIGQVCFELPTNLYRYVMPKRCCAKDCYYKIKNIEIDIDDEDLLNDEERKEAVERLDKLKKKIDWEKLKKLIGAIKLLRDKRNQVAHPPNVDEKGAKHAAQELDKQGKLKGTASIGRVNQIIEIWSVSKSL